MKKRTIALIAAAMAAIIFFAWPAPGLYLGHGERMVRVQVPGEGEQDRRLLLCRYLGITGYHVAEKWPADTPAGTLLLPNGEMAATDGQNCPVVWPWSGRE